MTDESSILFDDIEPFNQGFLKVSDLHTLYYEESGNVEGEPVLMLHGGPGACCSPKNRRRFDPKRFRVVLFDQRGCGQSTPNAGIEENTTNNLIEDIEKLRQHLNIDKWFVTGGSWGSTLALLYAESFPNRVTRLVLNGIFLGQEESVEWLHGPSGCAHVFPEAYENYINYLPEIDRDNPLNSYNKIINGEDKEKAIEAAVSMLTYEGKVMAMAENTLAEEKEREEGVALLTKEEQEEAKQGFERFAYTHSRIEGYYSENKFFIETDQILKNAYKLKSIPVTLIHGRYDMVCPIKNAYALYKALPESKLVIAPKAAHSTSEMLSEVVEAIHDKK